MPPRSRVVRKQELYMTFALCAISDLLLKELLDKTPFRESRWERFGFSQQTLDYLRDEVARHRRCFQAIHKYLLTRSACPDPPCPSEDWIGDVCEVALNTDTTRRKSLKRKG